MTRLDFRLEIFLLEPYTVQLSFLTELFLSLTFPKADGLFQDTVHETGKQFPVTLYRKDFWKVGNQLHEQKLFSNLERIPNIFLCSCKKAIFHNSSMFLFSSKHSQTTSIAIFVPIFMWCSAARHLQVQSHLGM